MHCRSLRTCHDAVFEGYHTYTNRDASIRAELKGNVFSAGNPFFLDRSERQFNVKKNFPAGSTGFRDIPFGKIGLLKRD
jgi:hypothetical protein